MLYEVITRLARSAGDGAGPGRCPVSLAAVARLGHLLPTAGVLASKFGDHPLELPLPRLQPGSPLDDPGTNLERAGKGDLRHVGMLDQQVTDNVAGAGDEVEHPGRQPA